MIRLIRTGLSLFLLFTLYSCQDSAETKISRNTLESLPLKYARGFSIFKSDEAYLLQIHSTDSSREIHQEIFIDRKEEGDSSIMLIHKKVKRVVSLSTTYLNFIEKLGGLSSIVGLSNGDLVYSDKINNLLSNGSIKDVGNDQSLNYEGIIELNSDAVLFYDFGPSTSATAKKLEGLGLNVIRINEFAEVSPLGKAEWIKFFGIILDKSALANRIFDDIESKYLTLKEKSIEINDHPSVFTGLPWKGEWYQPGGKSFQANFIKDAGGKYLWEDNEEVSGITVDREVVFDVALDADIWLHPSNALSLEDIMVQDERYGHFKSFKQGMVYNNNLRLNKAMGNDYWESGILNPHLILTDLMAIFHPEAFPNHEFTYYRKLN